MLLALGLARNKLLDHDLVGNKILAQSLAKKKKMTLTECLAFNLWFSNKQAFSS